jgi:hypothetical protein
MKDFTLKLTLPSGRTIRIKEISNRVYFNILKFCENQDYEGLNLYLEDIIFSEYKEIDIIDRLYIMLYYRMLFVSENIVFSSDSLQGKFKEVKYSLRTILEKIEEQYEDHTLVIKDKEISVTLGLPNTMFFGTVDDVYGSIIKSVTYQGKTVDLNTISTSEKITIIERLPLSVFTEVQKYTERLSQTLSKFVLIEANEEFDIQQHEINIISNGLMMFISSLFGGGLNSFYVTMFSFVSKLQMDSELFFNITPIEMRVIFNIHAEEVEEQQRREKENSRQM